MVYSTNLNGDIKKLTDGMYDYGSVAMAVDKIITKRHSISAADEIDVYKRQITELPLQALSGKKDSAFYSTQRQSQLFGNLTIFESRHKMCIRDSLSPC